MRKTPHPLLVLVALLAVLPGVAGAASPPRLHAVRVAQGVLLSGEDDATTVAVRGAGPDAGALALFTDGRAPVAVEAPAPECAADAVGAGVIAWSCGDSYPDPANAPTTGIHAIAVTRLDGTLLTRLNGTFTNWQADYPVTSAAVGAQWVTYVKDPGSVCALCDWGGLWSVNWHTGEQRGFTSSSTTWPDLDAPQLDVPLCRPVRLASYPDTVRGPAPPPVRVYVHAPYLLIDTYKNGVSGWALRRCGSSHPVVLPGGLRPVALGYGWVASGSGRAITLVRLRDRRRYAVAGAPATARIAFTRGHAYLGAASGGGSWSVALPR